MIAIVVGVLIYGIGLVSFRGVSSDEIARLPKGKLMIKTLRRLGLLGNAACTSRQRKKGRTVTVGIDRWELMKSEKN